MRNILLILFLCCASAIASDDPRATIDMLQAALQACQQQTGAANANALQQIATLTVQRDALAKRVQELEASTKQSNSPRP